MCWQWPRSDHFVLLFASLTFQDGPSAEARMKQASRACLLLAELSARGQVSRLLHHLLQTPRANLVKSCLPNRRLEIVSP